MILFEDFCTGFRSEGKESFALLYNNVRIVAVLGDLKDISALVYRIYIILKLVNASP